MAAPGPTRTSVSLSSCESIFLSLLASMTTAQ
jgi:hypothetical protein